MNSTCAACLSCSPAAPESWHYLIRPNIKYYTPRHLSQSYTSSSIRILHKIYCTLVYMQGNTINLFLRAMVEATAQYGVRPPPHSPSLLGNIRQRGDTLRRAALLRSSTTQWPDRGFRYVKRPPREGVVLTGAEYPSVCKSSPPPRST